MTISPFAGKQVPAAMLVNIPELITAYYTYTPDVAIADREDLRQIEVCVCREFEENVAHAGRIEDQAVNLAGNDRLIHPANDRHLGARAGAEEAGEAGRGEQSAQGEGDVVRGSNSEARKA